jgi:hypothetical protein
MVSTEFVAGAALLLLPVALLVALLPRWSEARLDAITAADQGARAAAVAVATGGAAVPAAEHAAAAVLEPRGRPVSDIAVRVDGSEVIVDLTVRMPALPLPWGDVGAFDWTATRTHPVDPYRSKAVP